MQEVRVIFVDNPRTVSRVLGKVFPSLGKGFYPGDSGVRGDTWHKCDDIVDTMMLEHPSRQQCMTELRDCFSMQHPGDQAQQLRALSEGTPWTKQRRVRQLFVPPHELLRRVLHWVGDWFERGRAPTSGEHVFTHATLDKVQTLMEDIVAWRYSGKT